MQADVNKQLNKRTEIFAKCPHREKFSASKFESARQQKRRTSSTIEHAILLRTGSHYSPDDCHLVWHETQSSDKLIILG